MNSSIKSLILSSFIQVPFCVLYLACVFGTNKVSGEPHNHEVLTIGSAECKGTQSCVQQTEVGDHTTLAEKCAHETDAICMIPEAAAVVDPSPALQPTF
jgi:hypothetical protein